MHASHMMVQLLMGSIGGMCCHAFGVTGVPSSCPASSGTSAINVLCNPTCALPAESANLVVECHGPIIVCVGVFPFPSIMIIILRGEAVCGIK